VDSGAPKDALQVFSILLLETTSNASSSSEDLGSEMPQVSLLSEQRSMALKTKSASDGNSFGAPPMASPW
jgi:hypothetical protein